MKKSEMNTKNHTKETNKQTLLELKQILLMKSMKTTFRYWFRLTSVENFKFGIVVSDGIILQILCSMVL